MPLIINTNTSSLTAQRYLTNNTSSLAKAFERLASGYKINRASDDAAGLQISESLRAQIRGTKKAADNVQDGINLLNIADGSMSVITENLQRIRELTVQAANDTNATAQRDAIEQEINARRDDIDRIANSTQFNGRSLLASALGNFYIQVGANDDNTNDRIDVASALGDATTGASGLNLSAADFADNAAAQAYLTTVDAALSVLNTKRSVLGSIVNRLDSAANNLAINTQNLSASESQIRNVDVAATSAELTRFQILQQAATSILSQANQSPQLALSLLNGR